MKWVVFIIRTIYGLGLVFFGLNGFYSFLEVPPPPEQAEAFMGGLASASYFFPLLKGTETVCGALLVLNVLTPLALVVLAPIVLHIFLYHFFLDPNTLMISIILGSFQIVLCLLYVNKFKPLFSFRPKSVLG